jgi:hypothetical protein
MSHDISGLVQALNDIAERKQPRRRAHRIVAWLIPNTGIRTDLARPQPQPPIDAGASAWDVGITTTAVSRPSALCA